MCVCVCVCVCVCRVGGRVVVCVPNMWFHLCYVALTYFVCVCGGGERGRGCVCDIFRHDETTYHIILVW